MKTLLMTALFLLVPALVFADGMGTSGGHDLDALWAQAQQTYDLELEDAVILLEAQEVTYSGDTLTTTVHRVVWIRTAVGIRAYADLRVPWNTTDSTLDVEILRTWRENTWWPDVETIGETAVVHTLPYAVDRADDYTTMRETMLLHDGVELGCIMETRYTLATTGQPGAGNVFVFPQRDPAVRVDLTVTAGSGRHARINGAPDPSMTGTTLNWRMENVAALKLPLTGDAAAYEPAVIWSTWPDWDTLGNAWQTAFEAAAELTPEQSEAIDEAMAGQTGLVSGLQVVANHLNDMTRGIHYPDRFWAFTPRPASRTLETAYGHTLDRAVLAYALLKEAGYAPGLLLLGQGHTLVGPDIPRLADFHTPAFLLSESNGLVFHPDSGEIGSMADLIAGPVWKLGQPPKALPAGGGDGPSHRFTKVTVNLEPGDDGWTGTLLMSTSGPFTPYAGLVTATDFKDGPVARLLTSLVPGAEITAARPEYLAPVYVEVRAEFTLPAPEDGQLVLGQPAGGLLDRLPGGVHLYDQVRESPVLGLGGFQQTVTLRIKTDQTGPRPLSLENIAGRFSLDAVQDGDWLTVTREIQILADPVAPADWPGLRELLLAESDPVHGTVELE